MTPDTLKVRTPDIVVQLENVSLRRDRQTLLQDVDWTVTRGQHWAVLGRNGAGKTLLLKILAGYLWPSRGEVRILDERFGGVDLRELRQDIGWVSSALTEKVPGADTALEVVVSGAYATFGLYELPPEDLVSRARRIMGDMGLAGLTGRRFADLSAGEKQRVLLARGRLPRPRLLILDEPCAGLDLAAGEKFLAQTDRLARDPKGPTTIMVTHRVSEIVPAVTHALLLHGGRILAAGPIRDVLTDDLLGRTLEIPLRVTRSGDRWRAEPV
ncbi:MAG: ATP-binding cassette domain-containing protein [Proteobacteria bacterium]|nr:ATP-binding cassette domain-containing protein [Pseudomonadota bacterium]